MHEYFSIVHPTSRSFDLDGVHVHRSLHLPATDIQLLDGIRVTTPERTLFDLASQLGPRAAYHLLETQFANRHPDSRDFAEWFADHRQRGVKNVGRIALLLDELLDDEPFPQSKLEIVVDDYLHKYGVHFMERQFRPPWYEGRYGITDFGDPIGGSILEADGAGSRKTTAAHENDRQRDLVAAKNGYLTLRAGFRAITQRPHAIFSDIAQILVARHEEGLRLSRKEL